MSGPTDPEASAGTDQTPTRTGRFVRWIAIGVGGVVVLAAVGFFVSRHTSGSNRGAHLSVEIIELPPHRAGSVVLRGPDGFRRYLKASISLAVAPGRYEIDASPVLATNDRYYPTAARAQVVAQTGRTTTATVDYRTVMSTNTRQLPKSALARASYSQAGSTLTFAPNSPEVTSLRPGDVLILGPIAGAERGLLVKATSIATFPNQTNVSTAPAHLEDVVHRGQLHARFTLPERNMTIGNGSTGKSSGAGATPTAISTGDPSFDWAKTFDPTALQGKGCKPAPASTTSALSPKPSSGTSASFTPSVHFGLSPFVDFTANVSLVPPSVDMSFTVGINEDFSAGLAATVAYNCDLKQAFNFGDLPSFPLPVPGTPFHLTVTPQLTANGEAKGAATGSADFMVSQSAKPSITLAYHNGFNLNAGLNPEPVNVTKTDVASGTGELTFSPQLEFNIQGRGGPYVSVMGYLMGAATTSPEGAGLWLGANSDVGINLDLFVKTLQYDKQAFGGPPTLVWQRGTTPSVPYDVPTASPVNISAVGLPIVACQVNCTVEAQGATITVEKSPTFSTPEQPCIGVVVNVTAGGAPYTFSGFANLNLLYSNAVFSCAVANVDSVPVISFNKQVTVDAHKTQQFAFAFGLIDSSSTPINPHLFVMNGDIRFDLATIGDTSTSPTSTTTTTSSHPTPTTTTATTTKPTASTTIPAGATALCNDGTYSKAQHRRGACSGRHGRVSKWLRSVPP